MVRTFNIIAVATAGVAAASPFSTSTLRCDGSDFGGPSASAVFAIDSRTPTFTWANEHPRRGERQTAFELVLREHRRAVAPGAFEDMPLVWSSGRVASADPSLAYPAAAPALRSDTSYAWSVRYWDSTGARSAFAAAGPARLHVALLDGRGTNSTNNSSSGGGGGLVGEWDGVPWLGNDKVNLFRSSFTLVEPPAQVEKAVAYVAGLGYSYVRVNGAPAGGAVGASPVSVRALTTSPWSNNFHRSPYSSIDVTSQLLQGENVLGVGLGHGWRARSPFNRKDADANADDPVDKVLRLQLRLTYTNGTSAVLSHTGDGSWTAAAGPTTADSVYDGETYDARLEQPGWDAPGFKPAAAWAAAPANPKPPQGVMSAWAAPAVVVDREIKPVGITNPKPNVYVVDFGTNLAGVCKLKNIRLAAGQSVVLRHAEVMQHALLPDLKTVDPTMIYVGNLRSAKATDTYTARGDAAGETFTPALTYHGFRFVEVTVPAGAPAVTADDIEMLHFHSAVAPKAATSFSSDTITKIQTLATGAQRSNMMTVATDCDQRDERLGWMGDMCLSSDSICLNYDCAAFANSFVQGMDDEMGADGSLTDVVPFVRFGNRPADVSWSAALVQTSWVLWKESGDLSSARTYYPDFLRQLDNVKAQAAAGLDKMHTPYGDWCPPPGVPGKGQGPKPSSPYTSAYSYVNMVRQTAQLAGALGNSSEATRLNAEADALVKDFNVNFMKTGPPAQTGRTTCGTIAEGQSITLQCGADPDDAHGGVIEAVSFADYGTPTGTCASPADPKGGFAPDPKCGCAAKSVAAVAAACVNKTSCALSVGQGGYCGEDPCYDTAKHLSVAVQCSAPAPAPTPPGPAVTTYDVDRMTDYTLALALGAADAAGTKAMAQARLAALVKAANNHFTSGIIGFKFLFDSLRDAGAEETALAILEQTDYPSIGFLFANSYEPATENLWELMDGYAEGTGMNSRNHHMWSSYSHYVVQRLGGIAPAAAGYRDVLLEPATTLGLSAANVSLAHAHGVTAHAWRRHGGRQCAKAAAGRAAALDCGAAGGVIEAVTFASFGRPRGVCGAFDADAACDAASSVAELERRCVGRARCDVDASATTFGSPGAGCSALGGEAWLWAEVRCSAPAEVHASVTLPVGATGTLHLPSGTHGIERPAVFEGGAPLALGGAAAAAPGVRGVARAIDHAGRDVVAVTLGSGAFDFVLKSE